MSRFDVRWVDGKKEPRHPPNPDYPQGKDITVVPAGVWPVPTCKAELPYPARRCGLYMVTCRRCGFNAGVTTAGRPDDPRSLTMPCQPLAGEMN